MSDSNTVETLRDSSGVVELGWVAPDVLLAQFEGGLSSNLGKAFAGRLREAASRGRPIKYFGDGSLLTHYELEARSAFIRVLLDYRGFFSTITVLMWKAELSGPETSIALSVGDRIQLLTDAAEFQRQVLSAAPMAQNRLMRRLGNREYLTR